MINLISNIKLMGFLALLTLTATLITSTWLLVKDNRTLRAQLVTLNTAYAKCELIVSLKEQERKLRDETLEVVLMKNEELTSSYGELQEALEKNRCKYIKPTSTGGLNETANNVGDVATDIANINRLLQKAACTANSNCESTEGSSKPL
jgi:hypothetical protein